MKVKELIKALALFDENADISARGGTGSFDQHVGLRVSKQKLHKGRVMIEGSWREDSVEVPD